MRSMILLLALVLCAPVAANECADLRRAIADYELANALRARAIDLDIDDFESFSVLMDATLAREAAAKEVLGANANPREIQIASIADEQRRHAHRITANDTTQRTFDAWKEAEQAYFSIVLAVACS